MTKKELLDKLKDIPDDAIIVITSGNFEQNYAKIEAHHITHTRGRLMKKSFRDAFDGETYNSAVMQYDKDGGNLDIIEIS